jgi:serine/threonine-protein kinase RsbT
VAYLDPAILWVHARTVWSPAERVSPVMQPTQPTTGSLPLYDNWDVVACRQTVRQVAAGLKFSVTAQTMLATAASELARNALIHGGGGRFLWEVISVGIRRGVRLSFEDDGPGIADIQNAMTDGWTSGNGLGLGLPGAKRFVNEFEIQSSPGKGTRVIITRWQ